MGLNGAMEALRDPVDALKAAGCKEVVLSMLIGGVLGMIIAFLVICTLVEISLSYFEAVLFGFILVLLGGFILARTLCTTDQPERFYRIILGSFAVLVVISGLCCFALQENWHKQLSVKEKIPIYFL